MNEYIRSDKLYSVSRFFCYIKHVLKGDLDNLYHQENECRSRWYQGVKNTASQNIKMKTLIKLSTAFEMSPGELMDYIIDFDKKKK